jgi:hypothetical protein
VKKVGKNKKEQLVFTTLTCACMVLGMSIYNVLLMKGFTSSVFLDVAIGFIPAFIVGLLLDIFVVGMISKSIVTKIVKQGDPLIKKILFMSFFMVSGMVLFMSLYGALMNVGWSSELPSAYIKGIGFNFIAALPLQLLIVGPIVRLIFTKIYSEDRSLSPAQN